MYVGEHEDTLGQVLHAIRLSAFPPIARRRETFDRRHIDDDPSYETNAETIPTYMQYDGRVLGQSYLNKKQYACSDM